MSTPQPSSQVPGHAPRSNAEFVVSCINDAAASLLVAQHHVALHGHFLKVVADLQLALDTLERAKHTFVTLTTPEPPQ